MNSILIAGIIGAIAGTISMFLVNQFYRNKEDNKTVKTIVTIVIFILVSTVAKKIILPGFRSNEIRPQIEKLITSNKEGKIYQSIKKHDPVEYEKLINELSKMVVKYGDSEELFVVVSAYGARLFSKYARETTPKLLKEYVKKVVLLIKELKLVNVDLTCSFLFPGSFKPPHNSGVVMELMEENKMFDLYDEIIIASKKKVIEEKFAASHLALEKYRTEYSLKYPDRFKLLSNPKLAKTKQEKILLIDAVIVFYEDLFKYEDKKMIPILKAIF